MNSEDLIDLQTDLLGSLLSFIQTYFFIRTGRNFRIEQPPGRQSHIHTICKALIQVMNGDIKRLIINVPPRYGKTEILIHFIAWALARFPDSNFLYVSYSHTLATKQTKTIREIITIPSYKKLFHVDLSSESSAKDNFETQQGGSVYAAGSGGTITGRGAGIFGCDRFGGAIVIDDIHKPDEVMSDTIREGVIEWYYNTMQSRLNQGSDTPIIFIGQRLHEYDLPGKLLADPQWQRIIIPALDEVGNPLLPSLHNKDELLKLKTESPYVFAAQYQQNPQPSGGSVFNPEWFLQLTDTPKIIGSFITADTSETDKTYNDATVFSLWGVYKITNNGLETDLYGLHWLDCVEIWVEPKDLESEFFNFYSNAMRMGYPPKLIAIEKKSTGVTLISTLSQIQGLTIIDIKRTASSGSKATRFLEIQPYISKKLVSLPYLAPHTSKCIEHCRKITLNDTHRYDDIADTLCDAVKFTLIDKIFLSLIVQPKDKNDAIYKRMLSKQQRLNKLKERSTTKW